MIIWEDILDVSTENLARLKEEALQIEDDTLMRYIRIFSELGGQIRYASQKRVQVEVAFIKLCRPAMETNTDVLLDRIRVLEEESRRKWKSWKTELFPMGAAGKMERPQAPRQSQRSLRPRLRRPGPCPRTCRTW